MLGDERRMHTFWQTCLGKLGKSTGEPAFIGNGMGTGETADAAQADVRFEPVDQGFGGG